LTKRVSGGGRVMDPNTGKMTRVADQKTTTPAKESLEAVMEKKTPIVVIAGAYFPVMSQDSS
jgi:hypothetical protein